MHTDTYLFVVCARRNASSIFGAASNPVMRNGKLLCFKTEAGARAERDRLTARLGEAHVRYSVRPVHVQLKPPREAAKVEAAPPSRAMPMPEAA
jgi:hypothetical protein